MLLLTVTLPPAFASTYAFTDCCVGTNVAELLAILSSSTKPVIVLPPTRAPTKLSNSRVPVISTLPVPSGASVIFPSVPSVNVIVPLLVPSFVLKTKSFVLFDVKVAAALPFPRIICVDVDFNLIPLAVLDVSSKLPLPLVVVAPK